MESSKTTKAIFFDRDGTINEDKGYVGKVKDFKFLPKALDALKLLSKTKYKVIIITSQGGIGRGYYSHEDFMKINRYMLNEFKKEKIRIDAIYFCHHAPEERCNCRKPATGLIEQAKKRFNIDLKKSFVIGDKTSDIMLGKNVGCKTILVLTGKAGKDNKYSIKPDFVAKNLLEAVKIIS